jgi:hypothetical protein
VCPPGTGKSAVSAVVARELVGEFTVIYVEAKAGAQLLTAVVEEARRLGARGAAVARQTPSATAFTRALRRVLGCTSRPRRLGQGDLRTE